jgi:hypothetical protein
MPVIGTQDYLQFQRNLIAESAAIYQRATAIENRVSRERQAQQAQSAQQQNQAANMAMALKRLAFDQDVQKARESYQDKTLSIQNKRIQMEQQLNTSRLGLEAVKLQTAELQRDALQSQLDQAKQRSANVVGLMKNYQTLLAARQPGEDGTVDQQAVNKASLDLLSAAILDPEAAGQLTSGLGVAGMTGLLPKEMQGLKIQDLTATIDKKRAEAAQLGAPVVPKTADEVAKVTWLEKQSEQFVQRHAQMTAAGYGTFSGVKQVREAKENYYKSNWREANMVNQQINNIRTAGLLSDLDMNALLEKEAIMGGTGDAVLERAKGKVSEQEGASAEAKKTTIAAIETLRGIRANVVAKAAGYDLIEGMMARREQVVRTVLNDVWADKKDSPNWATEITNEANATLKVGDDQWSNVLNDPDIMSATANYRADLNPNGKTWEATAATINQRLHQLGLDSQTRRYITEMIKTTHPSFHLIK